MHESMETKPIRNIILLESNKKQGVTGSKSARKQLKQTSHSFVNTDGTHITPSAKVLSQSMKKQSRVDSRISRGSSSKKRPENLDKFAHFRNHSIQSSRSKVRAKKSASLSSKKQPKISKDRQIKQPSATLTEHYPLKHNAQAPNFARFAVQNDVSTAPPGSLPVEPPTLPQNIRESLEMLMRQEEVESGEMDHRGLKNQSDPHLGTQDYVEIKDQSNIVNIGVENAPSPNRTNNSSLDKHPNELAQKESQRNKDLNPCSDFMDEMHNPASQSATKSQRKKSGRSKKSGSSKKKIQGVVAQGGIDQELRLFNSIGFQKDTDSVDSFKAHKVQTSRDPINPLIQDYTDLAGFNSNTSADKQLRDARKNSSSSPQNLDASVAENPYTQSQAASSAHFNQLLNFSQSLNTRLDHYKLTTLHPNPLQPALPQQSREEEEPEVVETKQKFEKSQKHKISKNSSLGKDTQMSGDVSGQYQNQISSLRHDILCLQARLREQMDLTASAAQERRYIEHVKRERQVDQRLIERIGQQEQAYASELLKKTKVIEQLTDKLKQSTVVISGVWQSCADREKWWQQKSTQMQKEAEETKVREVQDLKSQHGAEVQKLKQTIETLEAQAQENKEEIHKCRHKVELAQFKDLEQKFAESEKIQRELQVQIEDMNQDIILKETEIENLKSNTAKYDQLQKEQRAWTIERKQLDEKLKRMEIRLQESESEHTEKVQSLMQKLQQIEEEFEKQKEQIEEANETKRIKDLDALENKLKSLQDSKDAEYAQKVEQNEQIIYDLRVEMDQKDQQIESQQLQLDEKEQKNQELIKQMEQMSSQVQSLQNERDQKNKDTQQEEGQKVQKLEDMVSKLEEISKLENEQIRLQQANQELEGKVNSQDELIENLQLEITTLKQQYDDAAKEQSIDRQNSQRSLNEAEQFKMQFEMLKVEQTQQEIVMKQQKERIEQLEEFDRVKSEAFQHFQETKEQLEAQIIELNQQLEQRRSPKMADLNKGSSQLTSMTDLQLSFVPHDIEAQSPIDTRSPRVSFKKLQKKDSLQNQDGNTGELREHNLQKSTPRTREFSRKQEILQDQEEALGVLKTELEQEQLELNSQRIKLERDRKKLEQQQEESKEALSELEKQFSELKIAQKELEYAQNSLQQAQNELENERKVLKQAQIELKEAQNQLQSAQDDLQNTLQVQSQSIQKDQSSSKLHLENALTEELSKRQEINDKLTESNQKVVDLEKQLELRDKAIIEAQEGFSTTIQKFKGDIKSKNQEIESMKSTIQQMMQHVANSSSDPPSKISKNEINQIRQDIESELIITLSDDFKTQIEALQSKLNSQEQSHVEFLHEKEAEIENYKLTIAEKDTFIEKIQEQLDASLQIQSDQKNTDNDLGKYLEIGVADGYQDTTFQENKVTPKGFQDLLVDSREVYMDNSQRNEPGNTVNSNQQMTTNGEAPFGQNQFYNSLESGIYVATQSHQESEDVVHDESCNVVVGPDEESPLLSQLQVNVTEKTPTYRDLDNNEENPMILVNDAGYQNDGAQLQELHLKKNHNSETFKTEPRNSRTSLQLQQLEKDNTQLKQDLEQVELEKKNLEDEVNILKQSLTEATEQLAQHNLNSDMVQKLQNQLQTKDLVIEQLSNQIGILSQMGTDQQPSKPKKSTSGAADSSEKSPALASASIKPQKLKPVTASNVSDINSQDSKSGYDHTSPALLPQKTFKRRRSLKSSSFIEPKTSNQAASIQKEASIQKKPKKNPTDIKTSQTQILQSETKTKPKDEKITAQAAPNPPLAAPANPVAVVSETITKEKKKERRRSMRSMAMF